MIVLAGGGYTEHAVHEAEPIAGWLGRIGVRASVFRYPLPPPGAARGAARRDQPPPR
jgi:hypothetical protein